VGVILLSINPLFIFVRFRYFVARLGAGLSFFVLKFYFLYFFVLPIGQFFVLFGDGGRGLWP